MKVAARLEALWRERAYGRVEVVVRGGMIHEIRTTETEVVIAARTE